MFDQLVEQRIVSARDNGEFDRLAGRGRPLPLDDTNGVPEELRVAYRILKNAGMAPEQVGLRRSVHSLERHIARLSDDRDRAAAHKRLGLLKARLEATGSGAALDEYRRQLLERMGG